jgi:hypothetical protein
MQQNQRWGRLAALFVATLLLVALSLEWLVGSLPLNLGYVAVEQWLGPAYLTAFAAVECIRREGRLPKILLAACVALLASRICAWAEVIAQQFLMRKLNYSGILTYEIAATNCAIGGGDTLACHVSTALIGYREFITFACLAVVTAMLIKVIGDAWLGR